MAPLYDMHTKLYISVNLAEKKPNN